MPMAGFRVLGHTADVGLAAWGPDLRSAFAQAALGMFSLMADRRAIRPLVSRRIRVEATDREALLVAWLTGLLYYVDSERLLFRTATIQDFSETSLTAHARGEPAQEGRHRLRAVVKAATYHQLKVQRRSPQGGWRVQVYLDV